MTPDEALAWFDSLPPVSVNEMLGEWQGEAVPTGHVYDALLPAARWIGKRFETPDSVHPLIHQGPFGQVSVNPALVPLGLAGIVPAGLVRALFPVVVPLIQTRRPKARLRMMEQRGVLSATMIYNAKPICDTFRRIDAASVLGMMEQHGGPAPFFFRLAKAAT